MVLQRRDVVVAHCQLCACIDLVPDRWKTLLNGWTQDGWIGYSHEVSLIRDILACLKSTAQNKYDKNELPCLHNRVLSMQN